MKRLGHSLWFLVSIYLPIFISGMLVILIPASDNTNSLLSFSKFFWFTSIVFVATNAIGLLYGNPWHKEQALKQDWMGWDETISRKQRFMLGFNMTLWRAAWAGPVVTIWNLVAGGSAIPVWATVLASFLTGMVGVVYMVGAYRNVTGIGMHPAKQLYIWLSAGLLVPVACFIEGIAVMYSIVAPVKVFEVVEKN